MSKMSRRRRGERRATNGLCRVFRKQLDGARDRKRGDGRGEWAAGAGAEVGIEDAVVVGGDAAVEVGVSAEPRDARRWCGAEVGIENSVVVAGHLPVEVGVAEVGILADNRAGADRVAVPSTGGNKRIVEQREN